MMRVAILVYDGFDLIDAGGPYEVFLTASRLEQRRGSAGSFRVDLVSPAGRDVVAYGGMALTRLADAASVGHADIVMIPGTIDVPRALSDESIRAAVEALIGAGDLTTSVCTGAFLLAQAGVLDGLPATTHWEDVEQLAQRSDVAGASDTHRWVDVGDVVTSGGLTSGMHMALHLVDRFAGRELALATAAQLDLPFDPDGARA